MEWFLGAVILYGLIGLVFLNISENNREKALQKIAEDHGFLSARDLPSELSDSEFRLFKISNNGGDERHTLAGETGGLPFILTDLDYVVGHKDSSRAFRITIIIFRSSFNIPDFLVRPRDRWLYAECYYDRLKDESPVIDIFRTKKLQQEYVAVGKNRKAIESVFSDKACAYIASQGPCWIESINNVVLFCSGVEKIESDSIVTFIEESSSLVNMMRGND